MHVEFKFHKTSDGNRLTFLRALRSYSWVGRALVVDKMRLREDWWNLQDVSLYAASLAQLVARMPAGELGETIMALDQFGTPQTMLRELRARLKLQVGGSVGRLFKKVVVKRSRSESLIQCADMVAGALMREITGGDSRFFDLVRGKVTVWRL
jgi:hypothetical protein